MQIGPDGKIYCVSDPYPSEYLSVIHNPNLSGVDCYFEKQYLFLGENRYAVGGLPTFIQSYFNDPEYDTYFHCYGQPTQFNILNSNGIDSVFWRFKDFGNYPNDTSTSFSPLYTFSAPGTYYPELTVWSGFISKTVEDTVVIYASPEPQLGNDTSFCANEPILLTLYAGPGQFYSWHGGFGGGPQYIVTNEGTYDVKVTDTNGCIGRDTIRISRYPEPIVDTSNMIKINAKCGASNGSISGILVNGDNLNFLWKNSAGDSVSNTLSLLDQPQGIYTLIISYGSDCTLNPLLFEIKNDLAPQIISATSMPDHCNQGLGKINVNGFSGITDTLLYCIDGGNFTTSNLFENVLSGPHTVTVKDVNGCMDQMSVFVDNSVPGVLDSIAIAENGYSANGSITVIATGDSLTFSLNGGLEQNNGIFTGLSADDDYVVTITDKWGCTRLVNMKVERLNGITLYAEASSDYKCKKELAYSTLSANNFNNIKEYKAVLNYNSSLLNCISFHATPNFSEIDVTNYNGRVEVFWQNDNSISLPGNVPLVDLIFETMEWGTANVKWDSVASTFMDGNGNMIVDKSLNPGVITINNPPLLQNLSVKAEYCEGEKALIAFDCSGGTAPVEFTWQTPDQSVPQGTSHEIDSISLQQSGDYTIIAYDAKQCRDMLKIPITVYANPTAGWGSVDTIWFENTYELKANQGYASYEWSTGETTYYINVTKEGKYTVLMQTDEGCTALNEVALATTIVPINVPNAFTPNGDGLNDHFKPIVDTELIRHYHLSVYNKWGQCLYETSSPTKGWDGAGIAVGTYTWVIKYENRIKQEFEMKGTVTLIK